MSDHSHDTRTQISIRMDPEIHQAFKLLCVQKHTTMKNYITDLIRAELAKNEKEIANDKEQTN